MSIQSIALTCPNCKVTQSVDVDECGAKLDLVPCEGSSVKHSLCPFCRLKCFGCDLATCEDHSIKVCGQVWCDVCRASLMDQVMAEEMADREIEIRDEYETGSSRCPVRE